MIHHSAITHYEFGDRVGEISAFPFVRFDYGTMGARADYDQPVGRERAEAPPDAPPLANEGGLFRRFLDGFRYDSEA